MLKSNQKTLSELNALQEKIIVDEQSEKFNCIYCEAKFESAVDLGQHVKENHVKDQVSQTFKSVTKVTMTMTLKK